MKARLAVQALLALGLSDGGATVTLLCRSMQRRKRLICGGQMATESSTCTVLKCI